MAEQEYTVEKNTGYVPQATKDTPEGLLQDIERRAQAQVVTAKVESAKADEAGKAGASSGTGKAEMNLLGDIAANMLGIGGIANAAQIVSTRLEDKSEISGNKSTTLQSAQISTAKHIDDDIFSASRKPGIYRAPADVKEVGVKPSGGADLSNLSLPERVGLTSASLQGEKGTGNLKSWVQTAFEAARVPAVPEQVKTLELQNGAEMIQKQAMESDIASKAALDSVKVARDHQSAMRGPQGPGMGGMGMGMSGMNFDLSQGPRAPTFRQTEEQSGAA